MVPDPAAQAEAVQAAALQIDVGKYQIDFHRRVEDPHRLIGAAHFNDGEPVMAKLARGDHASERRKIRC